MPVRGRLTIQEKLAAQYIAVGMSLTDAAEQADIPLAMLRRSLPHPLFEAEIEASRMRTFPIMADRLTRRLEEVQEPALAKMVGLMEAESETIQFQSAKDLLNRGPLTPKSVHGQSEQPQNGATIHLDQQALQAILAGSLNAGQSAIIAAFAALSIPVPVTPQGPAPAQLIERAITLE